MKNIIYILFAFFLTLTSCKKSKEKSLQASKDYALVHHDLSYVVPLIVHTIQSQNYFMDRIRSGKDSINSCATYLYIEGDTVDISLEPVQFEILYAQCVDRDGVLKNGSIKCIVYDYFNADSSSCFISFESFSINDNIVSGSATIKKIVGNKYQISTSNLAVLVGTRQINYSGSFFYTMGLGLSNDNVLDNSLLLDDLGALTDRYGAVNKVLNNGIIRAMSCKYYSTGLVEIENEEGETQFLDFGTGSCDAKAIVTFNEEEIEFEF